MRSIFVPAVAEAFAPTRMAWLPGAYHAAQDFLDGGFAAAVRRRRSSLDLVFVDMDLAHVGDRTVLRRLHTDIVLPARAAGISLWLGGISLGGMVALDYAASYPDELDGLCLLAPYLGNRMLTAEIAQAPGLAAWQPGELAETDEERRIWRYIKGRRAESHPLYLGFGRTDRFAQAHELLAATLPAGSVDVIEGGHEWSTWSKLWENFLESHFA
ncbi:MAG TPA: alpha/beta hydrolase [Steroidobacteraceae bacterium]|nr:alpha/beta hydrolase [Steroidobacteraceae bacterium]